MHGHLRSSGDGTLFTLTMQFESQALRDGALEFGMTDGMSMSYDRLDGEMRAVSECG